MFSGNTCTQVSVSRISNLSGLSFDSISNLEFPGNGGFDIKDDSDDGALQYHRLPIPCVLVTGLTQNLIDMVRSTLMAPDMDLYYRY